MTLVQRISRNLKAAVLRFPRTGYRKSKLNEILIMLSFISFMVYLSQKMDFRLEIFREATVLQKLRSVKNNHQREIRTNTSSTTEITDATRSITPYARIPKELASIRSGLLQYNAYTPKKLQSSMMNLHNCTKRSPKLVGIMNSNPNITPSMDEVVKHVGPDVLPGGCFFPTSCKALQKVAIIIPFKDRDTHLKTLLYHLHPMLMRQRLHYCIYVVEQVDNGQFNKATIMNAGFEEALKHNKYDCIIFHDVDMIPENDKNFYMCDKNPRHLSPAIDKFQYKPHYGTEFGGVTGITPAQYRLANGHSNRFWGWGGEDNDMEYRIQSRNMSIIPSSLKVGRYMMIPHSHPWKFSPNRFPWKLNNTRKTRALTDGLSDLQYQLVETLRYPLFTKLLVDIRKVKITKLTLYIDRKPAMDIDLEPGRCRYEEFPGKYLDFVIELTDKKEAQDIPLWPGLKSADKSTLLRDNKIAQDGRKRRFSMLHNLRQAQDLCDKLSPECAGVEKENSQENYSLRRGGIPRHLVITGPLVPRPPTVDPEKLQDQQGQRSKRQRRYILPEKIAYMRYCPGEFSDFKPYKTPFLCNPDKACPHTYGFDIHIAVLMKPSEYLYYTDDQHFESHLEKGTNHFTFTWPNNVAPNPSLANFTKKFSFRTPDFAIPNTPGSYAVESRIVDRLRNPYFQWNWWFEITTGDKYEDARIREDFWKKRMTENVVRGRAKQHEAILMEKIDRVKKNQKEFDSKMKAIKVKKDRERGMPPSIEKVVDNLQKLYDKHEPEGDPADELFDPYNPMFQKSVGVIKPENGRDDKPDEKFSKVNFKSTTKNPIVTLLIERKRYHLAAKARE